MRKLAMLLLVTFLLSALLLPAIPAGAARSPRAPKKVRTIQNGSEKNIEIPDIGSSVDDATGAISFGATIRNLNKSKVAADIKVSIRALTVRGVVLSSTSMEVDAIPRNSTGAVGTTFAVSPDAAPGVDSIDVTVHVDRFEDQKKKLPVFFADKVRISEDGGNVTRAIGEIVNPFDEGVDLVTVCSVFYDGDGSIVGGAQSVVESIDAKGRANFDCVTPIQLPVDSTAIFVTSVTPEELLQKGS